MFELRWVEFGPNRQLEFRTRALKVDNWGDVRGVGDWTDWMVVPAVSGDEAAMQDLISSGGLPAVGG